MKVSTEIDNNFEYEKNTQLVDNIPLSQKVPKFELYKHNDELFNIYYGILFLKLLGQMEPNMAGSIYVRFSIKLLHLVPFDQQTWPLLLKIEHMVKLYVFGNN